MSSIPSAKAAQQIALEATQLIEHEYSHSVSEDREIDTQEVLRIISEALSEAVRPYEALMVELRKQAWSGEGSEQYRMGLGHAANRLEALSQPKGGEKV